MRKIIFALALFILVILPFIWYPLGSLDLGGDSSRIFFYDPWSYIYNYSLFFLAPDGINSVEPNYWGLPLFGLFALLRLVLSSYLLITLFSAFKLALSFVSIFLISREFLKDMKINDDAIFYASLIGGILYVFMSTMTGNWDRALLSHNQVFVNPFSFYLLLIFLKYSKKIYLYLFILFSFIFSANFGYTSAPPLFAFFPIAFIFLIIYTKYILKKAIPLRNLLTGGMLFLFIHAFHLIPQIVNLFDKSSYTNVRVFDKKSIIHEGVNYFLTILPLAKTSNYVLLTYGSKIITTGIIPFLLITGFILQKKNKELLILQSIFFLISLFLLSGGLTGIGAEIYKLFFYIPGFSMFRNFIGQWLFIYSFFYALLFSIALGVILNRLNKKIILVFSLGLIILILIPAKDFITGKSVNKVILPNTNTRIADTLDSDFLNIIKFLNTHKVTGRIIHFPLTDSGYLFVPGEKRDGAYLSTSLISALAGKSSITGYSNLEPFADKFLALAKKRDFISLKRLLKRLGVHYIIYNSDPFVLDNNNENFLYTLMRSFMPDSQKEYGNFIQNLGAKEVYKSGYYIVYKFNDADILPMVFATTFSQSQSVKANFTKISPVEYRVEINNPQNKTYVLSLLTAYHPSWKLYILNNKGEKRRLDEIYHDKSIKYPNMWVINPVDEPFRDYTIVIKNTSQNYFYIGSILSILTVVYVAYMIIRTYKNN